MGSPFVLGGASPGGTVLRKGSTAAIVAAVIGGWLGQAPAQAAPAVTHPTGSAVADERAPAPPAVWPEPQSLRAQGRFARITDQVTLVADPGADPEALKVVEAALRSGGARDVVRDPSPGRGLTVYAGTPALARLAALDAPPQGDLPSGGYRLAVDGDTVALAGLGDDGLFHAAQTLRQLSATSGGDRGFAGVTVRDWPTAPVRGIAEGFYGVPWTQAQRLDQLDFMARTKQNRFLYAPGDDPYRQARWREPYPADLRADFRALAQRARQDHVTLAWAVAPGQALCFSSPADRRALEKKLDAMWALGVRAFQLQFQDVSYSEWHCGADARRYGSGPNAAARAQADVANAMSSYLRSRYGGPDGREAPELSLLPTEFYQDGPTPYRTALAGALDRGVEVAWTGVGVLPAVITGSQVAGARKALGHPLMTVDNYPVNDYAPGRLFLGPYSGREPAVATVSAGVLAGAMQQPAASRIALFTAADYAWNARGYDPSASWRAAIDDLAGPDPATRSALAALAGNESSSVLSGQESVYLQPLVRAFWSALDADGAGTADRAAGLASAAKALRSAFTTMRTAPRQLDPLAGGTFGDEVRPWLDRLSAYGAAGEDAVDMLLAQARGDGQAAWTARQALDRDRAPLAQGTAEVGAETLDGFLSRAVGSGDAWLGLGADGRTPTTTMESVRGSEPSAMVDGKATTSWSSVAPPRPGDAFGVDLGTSRLVGTVRISMGDGSGSDGILQDAVLEIADDDGGWRQIGAYHDRAVITAQLPPGARARGIRLRATGAQPGAVTVREFAVPVSGTSSPSASGTGSDPGAVVDGDPRTQAGSGEVTVRFGAARPLDTVTVAAGPAPDGAPDSGSVSWPGGTLPPAPGTGPASGSAAPFVEARTPTGWRRLGTLDPGGWTVLPAGVVADAVRISDAVGVREVVPWFAADPRVAADRTRIDVEAGGAPALVGVSVDSGLPRDATVTVAPAAATAPGGHAIAVTAPARVPLRRGVPASVPLRVAVPAGTAPGTYTVPVRFTVAGRTVEWRLTVRTHPRTGGPDLVPGSSATSSGDETPDFPAAAVADGDPGTRWSSPVDDDAWVVVELPAPAAVGRVVLDWQDAYAAGYRIETSADGAVWSTAATVAAGDGGRETVWLDSPVPVRFLRVQGVRRATKFGYSLFGVEAYAVTG